jgi:hypothetical protein
MGFTAEASADSEHARKRAIAKDFIVSRNKIPTDAAASTKVEQG